MERARTAVHARVDITGQPVHEQERQRRDETGAGSEGILGVEIEARSDEIGRRAIAVVAGQEHRPEPGVRVRAARGLVERDKRRPAHTRGERRDDHERAAPGTHNPRV